MKLCIVVLLCACSFAVHADDSRKPVPSKHFALKNAISQRNNFYDQVREFIEKAVEEALKYLQSVIVESRDVGDKVGRNLPRLVGSVENQVKNALKLAQDGLKNLAGQSEVAINCTNKYYPALLEVVAIARVDLQYCVSVALQQAKSIEEEIRPLATEIVQLASALRNLAEDCWNSSVNVADAFKCVFSKGLEIRDKILRIAANVKNLVAIAEQKATAIIQEARVCVDGTATDARKKIEDIVIKVEQCIAEG